MAENWGLTRGFDSQGQTAGTEDAVKGGGVHHIAVRTPNYSETVSMEVQQGKELTLSCKFCDIKIAYLGIDQDQRADRDIQRAS